MDISVMRTEWVDPWAAAWHEHARSFSVASTVHTHAWSAVLRDAFGVEPALLLVHRGNMILGGVPVALVARSLGGKQWLSMPYSDHCPALCSTPEVEDVLLRFFHAQELPTELRGGYASAATCNCRRVGFHHTSDLTIPLQALRSQLRKGARCSLSRAEQDDHLRIAMHTDIDSLRTFYHLHVATRRRQHAIVQPWRYFVALHRHIIANGAGFVMLAWRNGVPIAGAVFLTAFTTITYRHAASLPEFWHCGPNHLIVWRAMAAAQERGYRRFDWGRTGLSAVGLRQFKLSWRPHEDEMSYLRFGREQRTVKQIMLLIRHCVGRAEGWLPVGFTRLAGCILYRQYP